MGLGGAQGVLAGYDVGLAPHSAALIGHERMRVVGGLVVVKPGDGAVASRGARCESSRRAASPLRAAIPGIACAWPQIPFFCSETKRARVLRGDEVDAGGDAVPRRSARDPPRPALPAD